MKRWHEDYKIALREWKKHKYYMIAWRTWGTESVNNYTYQFENQKGRFRKKDALDCGHAKCSGCHSDKFPKRSKTRKELKSDLDFKDQLFDL